MHASTAAAVVFTFAVVMASIPSACGQTYNPPDPTDGTSYFVKAFMPNYENHWMRAGEFIQTDELLLGMRINNAYYTTYSTPDPVLLGTLGATTTLTADQLLSDVLVGTTPNVVTARTVTLPTADDLFAALLTPRNHTSTTTPNEGDTFYFTFINTGTVAAGLNTITLAVGTGGSTLGAVTIAAQVSVRFGVRITNTDTPSYQLIRMA